MLPSVYDDETALAASLRTSIGHDGADTEEVIKELLLASAELRSVFSFYAKLDETGELQPDGAELHDGPRGISLAAWIRLVEDVRISKLVSPAGIFEASCTPASASDAAGLDELQFLGALVRLAHGLSRESADVADATQLLVGLRQVLHECVLPFARRDNSTSFNKVMGTRPELIEFLEETRKSFSGFGRPAPDPAGAQPTNGTL